MSILLALLKGFSIGGSLIVAIGAQNVFVIQQGLKRQHLLLTALLCSCIDAALITVGVAGFGHIISSYPLWILLMKYFAIIFLSAYGALSLWSAWRTKVLDLSTERRSSASAKRTLVVLLALSLLNPHVYLDAVVLLGSIAAQQPHQMYFALGAMSASFAWFFAITYGVCFLAPLLQKKNAWRMIDSVSGLIMWAIALTLLKSAL